MLCLVCLGKGLSRKYHHQMDKLKGGEIMVLWNILAGLLCFIGGFAACIGLIWLITNAVEKVSEYDEYDYYD